MLTLTFTLPSADFIRLARHPAIAALRSSRARSSIVTSGQDEDIEQLKASVSCATLLERLPRYGVSTPVYQRREFASEPAG